MRRERAGRKVKYSLSADTGASDEHDRPVAGYGTRHQIHFTVPHSFPRSRIKYLHAKIYEIETNPPPNLVHGGKDGSGFPRDEGIP